MSFKIVLPVVLPSRESLETRRVQYDDGVFLDLSLDELSRIRDIKNRKKWTTQLLSHGGCAWPGCTKQPLRSQIDRGLASPMCPRHAHLSRLLGLSQSVASRTSVDY